MTNTEKRNVNSTLSIVRSGNEAAVKAALDSGADVNAIGDVRHTPLHIAATYRHAAVIPVLLSAGANINAKNFYGDTPLVSAAINNFTRGITLLVEAGADIDCLKNHYPEAYKLALSIREGTDNQRDSAYAVMAAMENENKDPAIRKALSSSFFGIL